MRRRGTRASDALGLEGGEGEGPDSAQGASALHRTAAKRSCAPESARSCPLDSSRWRCTDRESHQGVTWGTFLRERRPVPTNICTSAQPLHVCFWFASKALPGENFWGVLAIDLLRAAFGWPVTPEGALHDALKRQREVRQVSVAGAHGLFARCRSVAYPLGIPWPVRSQRKGRGCS